MTARPKRRPEYVPPAVWGFAEELRASRNGGLGVEPLELITLDRLLSREAEPLWRDLLSQGVQPDDRQSWRILLEHFLGTTPGVGGFDAELGEKIKAANTRQHRIAALAEELAMLLEEHDQETSRAAISTPHELASLVRLLEATHWTPPSFKPWEKADLERSLRQVKPEELLWTIANAARDEERQPAPMYPWEAYGTSGYRSKRRQADDPEPFPVRKWIWFTDAAWPYTAMQITPPTVELGHTTKALLARLVLADHLGPDDDIDGEFVRKARKAATDPLPSDYVTLFGAPQS